MPKQWRPASCAWISVSTAEPRSSAAPLPEWVSRPPRRSAPRARTSPCSPGAATSCEREAERLGALPVRGDLTNPKDLERLVEKTLEAFGGIDILVNNGGGPPRTSALEITDETVESAVELLLLSAIRLTNLCLPHLRASGHGRIVNITSSSVREPIDNLALSNAVRPGVIGWAKTLAREIGPDGVTVNSIAPGTDRHRTAPGQGRGGHPAASLRPAEGDRRRRLLPRLRPGLVRHGRRDPGRRRPDTRAPLIQTRRARPYPESVARLFKYLLATGLVLAVVVVGLYVIPSDQYILLPDKARPLAPFVKVKGERSDHDGGGIYYVAVEIKKASVLEKLFPGLHEGSTLVPRPPSAPRAKATQEHQRVEFQAMALSQKIGAAVALKSLGYRVKVKVLGTLVAQAATDGPSAGKPDRATGLVVAVDGHPTPSLAELRRAIEKPRARATPCR